MEKISRRSFLKGTAATAASLAATSLLGACSSTECPTVEEVDCSTTTTQDTGSTYTGPEASRTMESWLGSEPTYTSFDEELSCDVIVVGAGLSGVCAARTAAEAGKKVIQFERTTSVVGRSGDFGIVGSEVAKENWGRDYSDRIDDMAKDFMMATAQRPNQRLIRRWMKESGPAFDWYVGADKDLYIAKNSMDIVPEGVDHYLMPLRSECKYVDPATDYYPCYQVTAHFYPDHTWMLQKNLDVATETGNLTTYFSTKVESLIHEEGKVSGVIARSISDGKIYKVTAKSVVLATGDYSGDANILSYYHPWVSDNFSIWPHVDEEGNKTNDGSGHRLGLWAGAKMDEGPHAPMTHNMGGVLGVTPFLELDLLGRRFFNEDVPGQEVEFAIQGIPSKTAYQIFDDNWDSEIESMAPLGHGAVSLIVSEEAAAANSHLTSTYGYANRTQVDAAVEEGRAIKADTLEELLKACGYEGDNLTTALASIERYNELAKKGVDEDFGKQARRMFALEKAPYYACKISPTALLVCMNGLQSDEYARVLGQDGTPIKGLYACGNVQGSRFSVEYPITIPGASHSLAMTYGRLAGQAAAEEL